MRVACHLVSLLVLTSTMLSTQTPSPTGTIDGFVRNLKTGEPIADVRIALSPESGGATAKSDTTDSDGHFRFSGLSPARYLITATRTLFYRPRRGAGPTLLEVAEGQRLTDVRLFLSPTGVIAGRVVDESRAPVRSVGVEALRNEYRNGVRTWFAVTRNTTDDRGEYRLFNLEPGTYFVRATQPGAPAVYYPGVVDSLTASPVTIGSGLEASAIDISLLRTSLYSAQFKLSGVPTGGQVLFTARRLGATREPQTIRTENLPDNVYRVGGLVPGDYEIFVRVMSAAGDAARGVTHSAIVPVRIRRSNEDLGTIGVNSTVSVMGRIVVSEPLPSTLDPQRLTLSLSSMDLPTTVVTTVRGTTAPSGFNVDGTFTIDRVIAGRYLIQASGLPANTYLISAHEGARDVLDTGFTVNGNQGRLELLVGGPGSVANVRGTVLDALGQTVPASTVVLVPSPERRSNPAAFKTATTDQHGNYVVRGVLPGEYRVMAWEELQSGAYMDPDFLKNYETRGEPVRLQRGAEAAVTVRVFPSQ